MSPDVRISGTSKVDYSSIKEAAEEYRETPLIASINRSCNLDKAILVSICKHIVLSGSLGMTSDDIWGRLTDLIAAIKTKIALNIGNTQNIEVELLENLHLEVPPMNIFIERLIVLCDRGILKRSFAKFTGDYITNAVISSRLQVSDIKSALLKTPFISIFPTLT